MDVEDSRRTREGAGRRFSPTIPPERANPLTSLVYKYHAHLLPSNLTLMRSFSHPPLRPFLLLRSPKSVSYSSSPSIRPRLLLLKRDRSNPSFLKSFSLLGGADLKCPPASLRSDLFSPSARAGMASVVGEGSVAARLWLASSKEALLGSYTPFVVLLAAGTLDMDTFRRYIAQDAYFLRAFAQA